MLPQPRDNSSSREGHVASATGKRKQLPVGLDVAGALPRPCRFLPAAAAVGPTGGAHDEEAEEDREQQQQRATRQKIAKESTHRGGWNARQNETLMGRASVTRSPSAATAAAAAASAAPASATAAAAATSASPPPGCEEPACTCMGMSASPGLGCCSAAGGTVPCVLTFFDSTLACSAPASAAAAAASASRAEKCACAAADEDDDNDGAQDTIHSSISAATALSAAASSSSSSFSNNFSSSGSGSGGALVELSNSSSSKSSPQAQVQMQVQKPSAMLHALSRDCHAQSWILGFLSVESVASLHACCSLWRDWVENPPASVLQGIQRQRLCQAEGLQQLALCGWARRWFTTVSIDVDDMSRVVSGVGPLSQGLVLHNRALLARICFALARFRRLRVLHVALCYAQIHLDSMRLCLQALAQTLAHVSLDTWGADSARAANAFLGLVHWLPRLETLELSGCTDPAPTSARLLDFSNLPNAPSLSTFVLGEAEADDASRVRFTAEQVSCLARCKALTSLEHACWSPSLSASDFFEGEEGGGAQPPSPLTQIAEGVALLARGQALVRAEAEAEAAGGGRATLQGLDAAPPQQQQQQHHSPRSINNGGLQRLSLSGTLMTAGVWEHVSTMTTLTSLAPQAWGRNISMPLNKLAGRFRQASMMPVSAAAAAAAGSNSSGGGGDLSAPMDLSLPSSSSSVARGNEATATAGGGTLWDRLANFAHLRHFDLRPQMNFCLRIFAAPPPTLCSTHFLGPLLKGSGEVLEHLALGPDLSLSAAQLDSIARCCPRLTTLHLRAVALEDLAALAPAADHLTTLMMEYCSGPLDRPALQVRAQLPALPRLSSLLLWDRCRLPADCPQTAILTAQLLARCPALTPNRFSTNLMAPLPVPVPAPSPSATSGAPTGGA